LSAAAATCNSDGFEAQTSAAVANGIVVLMLPSEAFITVTADVTFAPEPDPLTAAVEIYARLPSGKAATDTGCATETTTAVSASLDASSKVTAFATGFATYKRFRLES